MRPIQMMAALLIAQTMAGCSGSPIGGPTGPTGPTTPAGPTGPTTPAGPTGPVTPIPSDAPKPTISTISPDTGSVFGGSWVTITGEFDRRATATLGGIRVSMGSNFAGTIHGLITPPHAAGPVDILSLIHI